MKLDIYNYLKHLITIGAIKLHSFHQNSLHFKFICYGILYSIVNNQQRDGQQSVSKESINTLGSNFHIYSQCRICLDNETETLKRFISPCDCSGTLKYVHESCIRNWIESTY